MDSSLPPLLLPRRLSMLLSFPDFPLLLPFISLSPFSFFFFLGVFLFRALGSMCLYTCTAAVAWRGKMSRWLISYSAVFCVNSVARLALFTPYYMAGFHLKDKT
jgi:hypothetical protein